LKSSEYESYNMFAKGNKSVEQISKERKITVGTIYEHLADMILIGQSVDLNRLEIKQEEIEELEVIVRQEPIKSNVSKLKPIKTEVDRVKLISYDKLKILVACLKRKYGLMPDGETLSLPTTLKRSATEQALNNENKKPAS